jgi:allantoinase
MSTVAELVSTNPARRLGLPTKGDIAPGFDADIALVNPDRSFVVDPADSESTQEYTPFRGMEIGATVETTFLRGQRIFDGGEVLGEPRGSYLHRPTGR